MAQRPLPLILPCVLFGCLLSSEPVFPQSPEETSPTAPAEPPSAQPESPEPLPSDSVPSPAAQSDHQPLPEPPAHEPEDQIALLGDLRSAVRASPDSADDRLRLADALYRIGDLESAVDEYRIAVRLNPDQTIARLRLGVALMTKQDWHGALAELKASVKSQPDLVQAHYNLGTVHYTLGNSKAAIQSYQDALQLQPEFPDARYRLALVLKLANRGKEAAEEWERAAEGGVAKAAYFLGNAYRTGQGVEKNQLLAISWWVRAAEQGVPQAVESLVQFRQAALKSPKGKEAQALGEYRRTLWRSVENLSPTDDTPSAGAALVKAGRAQDAVPLLIREAYALPETARPLLETLYEHGADGELAPFDPRILRFFESAAAAGLPGSRLMLAQIYARGLGVEPDPLKAQTLLKGFAKGPGESPPKSERGTTKKP